eukprot:SM000085S23284  [mRNA]  locus=s85:516915:518533:+ [translate_table: standard]
MEDAMARLAGLRAVLTAAQRRRRQLADAADGALQQQQEELRALAGCADDARSVLRHARASLAEQSAALDLSRAALLRRLHSAAAAAQSLPAAKSRLKVAAKLLEGPGGQGQFLGLRYCLACRRAAMVGLLNRILPLPPPALVGRDPVASAPSDATLNGLSGRSHKQSKHTQTEPAEAEEQVSVKAAVEERVQVLDRLALQRVKALAEHLPASQLWPTVIGDKQQQEAIATALGYVAHEGQDLTRFAYAIFLLNKDLEQLLSTLDRSPVGPRHTLPNVHCLVESILQLPKALLEEKE